MPTIPGPIPQTTPSNDCDFAHASADGDRDRLHVAVVAGRDGDRGIEQPAFLQHPHGVGERDRQSATSELHVGDTLFRADRCTDRCELAVQAAADDRHAVERLGERPVFLDRAECRLAGRVRQCHHVRSSRAQIETAREVDVKDVETARAELEARAWAFTITVSPSSTGPVWRG